MKRGKALPTGAAIVGIYPCGKARNRRPDPGFVNFSNTDA